MVLGESWSFECVPRVWYLVRTCIGQTVMRRVTRGSKSAGTSHPLYNVLGFNEDVLMVVWKNVEIMEAPMWLPERYNMGSQNLGTVACRD